jgi:hypothetical protein
MCDPVAAIMTAASAASTGLGILQQSQQAGAQRADLGWLGAQQRYDAEAAEARARQAEQQGEADAAKARQKAALQAGKSQARFAAQGTDLSGSPLDLLGDIAASGQEDALSLRYQAMRDAWEHRVQGTRRMAQARYYENAAAAVDPTMGIVKSLLS